MEVTQRKVDGGDLVAQLYKLDEALQNGRDADGESDPLGDLEGAKNAARRLDDECREIERGETPRELVGTRGWPFRCLLGRTV